MKDVVFVDFIASNAMLIPESRIVFLGNTYRHSKEILDDVIAKLSDHIAERRFDVDNRYIHLNNGSRILVTCNDIRARGMRPTLLIVFNSDIDKFNDKDLVKYYLDMNIYGKVTHLENPGSGYLIFTSHPDTTVKEEFNARY